MFNKDITGVGIELPMLQLLRVIYPILEPKTVGKTSAHSYC